MDVEQRAGIGQVVRTLREARGMSRGDLAEATRQSPVGKPVSAEMIAKIEQGRKGPSVASLSSLAFGLGIEVEDLAERSHAWQAAAAAGAGAAVLRAGTVGGTLAGAVSGALLVPGMAPLAVGGVAAKKVIDSQRKRRQVEAALRDRLASLSDEDLAKLADALGVKPE